MTIRKLMVFFSDSLWQLWARSHDRVSKQKLKCEFITCQALPTTSSYECISACGHYITVSYPADVHFRREMPLGRCEK